MDLGRDAGDFSHVRDVLPLNLGGCTSKVGRHVRFPFVFSYSRNSTYTARMFSLGGDIFQDAYAIGCLDLDNL